MSDLPEHVRRNREAWDRYAPEYAEPGHRSWASDTPDWGIFGVPDVELGVLPRRLDGLDAIELGCGTAYVSAWLARRGARPVGIDNSPAQLENARRYQHEFGIEFPLHLGNAEQTPFPDNSFDLAISEYGASIWCDPYRWIPEASRLLRPGGQLIYLVNGTIHMLCTPDLESEPATDRLLRDYFGMHRFEWPDDTSVEFHIGYGDMIRLLRGNGFEVEDLIEVRPPADAISRRPNAPIEWARRWPVEEIWKARKRSALRLAPPRGEPIRCAARKLRSHTLLQRSFSMPDVSPIQLIIVMIIALVVLGPKRLPEMGKSLGKGIREFKQSVSGDDHPPLPAPIPPAENTHQS